MLEQKRLPLMDWKFGEILDFFFFQKEDKFDGQQRMQKRTFIKIRGTSTEALSLEVIGSESRKGS